MTKRILIGIERENCFSPNHIGNDGAIFNQTVRRLEAVGYGIKVYTESAFLEVSVPDYSVLFGMPRGGAVIRRLQQLEDNGCLVINSAHGIENCTRERMTRLLLQKEIPHPQSLIVDTSSDLIPELEKAGISRCWVKRGDFHTIHKEDVSYARHPQEAQDIVSEYAMRGIRRAVINRHLEGDLIKFYGVSHTSFFYWFYPFEQSHSKFGWEKINDETKGIPFSEDTLRHICTQAANVLNVQVYGGDCIVSPNGAIHLIDFNDWPSFAPCRDDASENIAHCIAHLERQYENYTLSNTTAYEKQLQRGHF